MAITKKGEATSPGKMSFDEARLFLHLKWYVEDMRGEYISMHKFSSIVAEELESVKRAGRGNISELHIGYLIDRHRELAVVVPKAYASDFRKHANNGQAVILSSLKTRIEESGIAGRREGLSWEETGAVILYIIKSVAWENTKRALHTLIRNDLAEDDGYDGYSYLDGIG